MVTWNTGTVLRIWLKNVKLIIIFISYGNVYKVNECFSDLPEHALCRTVVGPFVLRVSTGLLHRMEKVREAAAVYDYQPYASPPTGMFSH